MSEGEKEYSKGLKTRLKEKFPDLTIPELCQIFKFKLDVVRTFLDGKGDYIPSLALELETLLKNPDNHMTAECELVKKYFLKNFNPITTHYMITFGMSKYAVESLLSGHNKKDRKILPRFYRLAYIILKEELMQQQLIKKDKKDEILDIVRTLKKEAPEVLLYLKQIYEMMKKLEELDSTEHP